MGKLLLVEGPCRVNIYIPAAKYSTSMPKYGDFISPNPTILPHRSSNFQLDCKVLPMIVRLLVAGVGNTLMALVLPFITVLVSTNRPNDRVSLCVFPSNEFSKNVFSK